MAIFLLAMVAGSCAGLAQPRGLTAHMSRRAALALAPSLFVAVPMIAGAADDETALVAELKDCVAKLKPLSAMLDKEQWDPVRTVLKNPPVANLYVYHSWNLGVSRNTIRKLATVRGDDAEMIEYVESVAGALQLADQFVYDNVFVYFQPGNGKVKLKEPKDQLKLAIKGLNEVIALTEQ